MNDCKTQLFQLDIPEDAWDETGFPDDPAARLFIGCTRLTIAGMPMHLEAFAVTDNDEGTFIAEDARFNDEIEAIFVFRNDDVPDTLHLRGRRYVIVAYPTG